jgi:hypothetical protein
MSAIADYTRNVIALIQPTYWIVVSLSLPLRQGLKVQETAARNWDWAKKCVARISTVSEANSREIHRIRFSGEISPRSSPTHFLSSTPIDRFHRKDSRRVRFLLRAENEEIEGLGKFHAKISPRYHTSSRAFGAGNRVTLGHAQVFEEFASCAFVVAANCLLAALGISRAISKRCLFVNKRSEIFSKAIKIQIGCENCCLLCGEID